MHYIDTDVLVHSLIKQNPALHTQVKTLLNKFVSGGNLSISWLSVQEAAFVLGKLNQPSRSTTSHIDFLTQLNPIEYNLPEFKRATELAGIIGYRNFSDCLHVAIAEQHCTDLYTCNIKDFRRLQPHTVLKIHFIQ
ncbi:PIN domain-containing protein [Mucilaginibacter sp. ZT4R22]|uniref:PIN domain-containing protein n=1 Tax=Mucilaginibacter pankratovii TaxID=2772110 RepID=A0ABR7WVH6_9SPHI|nr:PIN domain-containing protein [Mucilaginibacter pankratovii]MBD1365572.1 PIN domain-containing protein [Mucilaginibacter pankratovii]